MTKHRLPARVSDRIWRTVVFSGAMLGAPLVAAEPPAKAKPAEKQVKPKAPPPDTVASVQKELDAVNKRVDTQQKAVTDAQNDASRRAAKAKLEAARKEKADLEKRLFSLKVGTTPPINDTPVARLERQRALLDTKITAAVDAMSAAQNDADRKAAKAKLTSLQNEREGVDKQLAAEKAKSTKRPRTDESDKPIGRGFILA